MNWEEYTRKAKTTTLYDTPEKVIHCTSWSLIEELQEFLEKEWEHAEKQTPESLQALQCELGDMAWGLAVLTDHFNYDPSIGYYSQKVGNLSIYSFASFAKALNKSARDDNWKMSEDKRRIPFFTFCDELYNWILKQCENNGWNLSDILSMNIEKLFSRKEKGLLSGDGDNRGEETNEMS